MGAELWGQGQEFAGPTDIRSHGSRVQTPSRQAGLKNPAKRMPRIRRPRANHRVRSPKLGSNPEPESPVPALPSQCRIQPRASMNQRITTALAATETTITSVARSLTDSTWVAEAVQTQVLCAD